MKLMGKKLSVSILIGSLLVLVANTAYAGEWEVPAKWRFIKIAGGSARGSFTPLAAKLADLINKQIPGVNASSTIGAMYSNCTAIEQGKMQVAFNTVDALTDSYYGLGRMEGKATKGLRFIGALHFGVYYIFVPKNSDIKDLSEIAKRPLRTSVGTYGSAIYNVNELVLRAYGSSIKDLEARGGTVHKQPPGTGVGMMKNGQIDYMVSPSSLYSSHVTEAATSPGIRFLELGPKEKAKLKKWTTGIVEVVVPKDMYPGIKKDYNTLARYYMLICHKDMPEELVYRITKVFWDNLEQFQAVGAFAKYIKLETAFKGMTAPIHPGAARYYKEKGMTPPEPIVPERVSK